MRLKHLSLANFRNFLRLEWDLPPSITLLQGGNAQGKTNLLEAVYYLSTANSPHAEADRQLINWLALEGDLPYARLVADVEGGPLRKVELVILFTSEGRVEKKIKVNGAQRRVGDLVGLLKVVLFLPDDVDLVAGPPSQRRRYMDELVSQLDPSYARTLQEYERVLRQRNHLLRRLRDRADDPRQLEFWDRRLIGSGSQLIAARLQTLNLLQEGAEGIHWDLTGKEERLRLFYRSTLPLEGSRVYQLPLDTPRHPTSHLPLLPKEEIASLFAERLSRIRDQERARGLTLIGPHRDDLRFFAEGIDLNIYGSRGQQRTCALSLKLAQVGLIRSQTGEKPILLLDDVMSELDRERGEYLLSSLGGQTIITATELSPFPKQFLERVALFKVEEGRVEPLSMLQAI